MRRLAGLFYGAALGFVMMVALAAVSFKQITKKAVPAGGLEYLAPGSDEWQPIAAPGAGALGQRWIGKAGELLVSTGASPNGAAWNAQTAKWQTTQELPPTFATHPTITDVSWRALPGEAWLTTTTGDCAPMLEPEKTRLPAIARCDPEKINYRLSAATKASDGALLVTYYHDDDQTTRAWRLDPGAQAWMDTGVLPLVAASEVLVAGTHGDALVVGGDGRMVRYDKKTWAALPRMRSDRIGWQAALTKDGGVIAGGGFPNEEPMNRFWLSAIVVGFVALALWLAKKKAIGFVALIFGGTLGVALAIAAFFILWIAIGARI